MHALDELEGGFQSFSLFDGDDTFVSDLLEGVGEQLADLLVVIGRDGTDLLNFFADRLKVVKVNVDNAATTAAKYGVLSVPTLLLIRDGEVKEQVVGLLSKQALTDKVEKVL